MKGMLLKQDVGRLEVVVDDVVLVHVRQASYDPVHHLAHHFVRNALVCLSVLCQALPPEFENQASGRWGRKHVQQSYQVYMAQPIQQCHFGQCAGRVPMVLQHFRSYPLAV